MNGWEFANQHFWELWALGLLLIFAIEEGMRRKK